MTISQDSRATVAPTPRMPFPLGFVLVALVLALKAPDALTNAQFWAQDGSEFFLAQHGHLLPRVFEPAEGQLQLLLRLIAWVATLFSTVRAPLIYNLAALACGAAALASLRNLEAFGLSFGIVLVTLALVPTNGEVFGNVTNLQWLLQFYFVSMFARLSIGAQDTMVPLLRMILTAAVALTCAFPTVVVATGLSAWVWLRSRNAAAHSSPISSEWLVLAACAGAQAGVFLLDAGAQAHPAKFAFDAYVLFIDSLPTHIFGLPLVTGTLLLVSTLALVWLALRGAAPREKAFVGALALFVALPLAATAHRFAAQPGLFLSLQDGDRYFLLLKMFFWWMLALAVARHLRQWNAVPLGAIVVLLGANAVAMSPALVRRPLIDLHWRDYARRIDAGESVDVPINPPPWQFHMAGSRSSP